MRFDLHTHTHYSPCGVTKPLELLKAAKKAGLDGIAVTDHHSFKGAIAVKRLNRDRDFNVILGTELSSSLGHILCINIHEMIKSRDFHEVVDEVRQQQGFIAIAHPFRQIAIFKMRKAPLQEIIGSVDAIEVLNGRTFFWQNLKARRFAESNNTGLTAGSDSHFPFEVGKVTVEARDDLYKELRKGKAKIRGTTVYGMLGNVMSVMPKYLRWKKR